MSIYIRLSTIAAMITFFSSIEKIQAQNIVVKDFKPAPTSNLSDPDAVLKFLVAEFPIIISEESKLILQNFQRSPLATYYNFKQTYKDIEIINSAIKVCVKNDGQIEFVAGNYFNTGKWDVAIGIEIMQLTPTVAQYFKHGEEIRSRMIILADELGSPVKYIEFDQQSNYDRSHFTIITDADGNIHSFDEHKYFFSPVDSVVTGNVFLPDPLTSHGTVYGGDYSDNFDEDNAALLAEQFIVDFKAQFENDTFYLRNDNVIIKDLGMPFNAAVTSMVPEFIYSRSDNGFEDVNTFYHITNFNNYITEIGYPELQNFYIEIDPHGAGGADQSFYISATIPSIQYGEGGVDDAEDADVILHEYGHALSDHAAPGSNVGLERHTIDEGYGDYFAVSYSRMFSDFNWPLVFSWDGHNEFWNGRNANTSKHYPEDNSDDVYSSSEIWSGVLMDIFDAIGKENTDKIVCESLYGSFPNMTMPDAAEIVLSAEENLFAGTYYDIVYDLLDARGLINPISIAPLPTSDEIRINNTAAFAFDNQPLIIELPMPDNFELTVYSTDGKIVYSESGYAQKINLSPVNFISGCYILSVKSTTNLISEMIVKF
ncbi:MAG: hypothetical protein ACHQFW_00785 [Chitinophagales bacterium]